ncbi:MAG: hypothetical protein GF381_02340 [Candidatus Pacebacteria bacterium]|nr:hypothetical protein [Candidatus Paceibacterota bacterium]
MNQSQLSQSPGQSSDQSSSKQLHQTFSQPQQYQAIFEDKIELNDKFTHYSFELKKPHRLEFQAGQYLSLDINQDGQRRSYSIISDPDIQHGVEILVDTSLEGPGTAFLQNLQFGQEVRLLAPLGNFTVDRSGQEQALTFVATGAGVAPFLSMILDQLKNKKDTRPIMLYWGLRQVDEMVWEDDFAQWEKAYSNFKFHPVISQPVKEWPLCRGRVTDCLQIHQLLPESGYYLCGRQEMIDQVSELLQAKGVGVDKLHQEKFY